MLPTIFIFYSSFKQLVSAWLVLWTELIQPRSLNLGTGASTVHWASLWSPYWPEYLPLLSTYRDRMKPEEGIRCHRNEVEDCEPPCPWWESKVYPLQEPQNYMYVNVSLYVCAAHVSAVLTGARRGHQNPQYWSWRWLRASMSLMRI